MPIFTRLGAECTILDYSDRQLEAERKVARREGYAISIIKGDMTQRLPFEDGSFDIIFHPVSNCYVEDVYHVWNECFRVLKSGGVLLAGFDNGLNFLFEDDNPLLVVNPLPFNPLKMPRERFERMAQNYEGIQFSHSMEEQLGGQRRPVSSLRICMRTKIGRTGWKSGNLRRSIWRQGRLSLEKTDRKACSGCGII